jgi:hypothetical protein
LKPGIKRCTHTASAARSPFFARSTTVRKRISRLEQSTLSLSAQTGR